MAALTNLDRTRYLAQQYGIAVSLAVADRLARTIVRQTQAGVPAGALNEIRRRHGALLTRDLANVAGQLYPQELLFQLPAGAYLRCIPDVVRDVPKILRRMATNDFASLPLDADPQSYPAYYRRTFHWQSDGYLSRSSAQRYDATVELLFRGTADVMRRQIIPPITRHLRALGTTRGLRVLDIASGTGRALSQLAIAHPKLRYVGLDLSPYYLAEARRVLDHVEDLSLVVENAEHLPFPDGYFDIATSVFLFHELPKDARRNVLREAFRTLKPGGLIVIEDSAQLSESGELGAVLQQFSAGFHEPYYKGYIADDLSTALREVGFEVTLDEVQFVSKVVAARKPQRAH